MKHTKGPWIATDDYDVRQQKTGDIICIFEDSASSCFDENNARLIAAAPDMLDSPVYFVKRVREGSIRSKKTYAKYVEIFERATGMSIVDVLNEYENQ